MQNDKVDEKLTEQGFKINPDERNIVFEYNDSLEQETVEKYNGNILENETFGFGLLADEDTPIKQ